MVCQLYLEGNKIDSNFFRGIIAMSLLPINNNTVTIYTLKLCRNNFFLELLQIVVTRLVSEIFFEPSKRINLWWTQQSLRRMDESWQSEMAFAP